MIVKMKKITLLCMAEEKEQTLGALRDTGVLHLEYITPPEGKDLDHAEAMLEKAKNVKGLLSQYKVEAAKDTTPKNASDLIKEAHELSNSRKSLSEKITALHREESDQESLGDFKPETVKKLIEKGINIKFYHSQEKEPVTAPEGAVLVRLLESSAGQYFALIGRDEITYDAEEIPLPERSLSAIRNDISETSDKLAEIEKQLKELSKQSALLHDEMALLEQNSDYIKADRGMGESGKIAFIRGYCPAEKVADLQSAANANGWGLVMEDPSGEDKVPTLIKYPAWVKVMKPVFDFLGILPGYKETDIGSMFFIFLTIFFAMIIGDAGYGLTFLVLLPILRKKKFQDAPAAPFKLMYIFSTATVIWGVITANYFGILPKLLPAPLQALRIDWLADQDNAMTFSLILGGIHLTIAHTWKAIIFGRHIRTLIQIAWIAIIWGVFAGARFLLMSAAIPQWFIPIPIIGLVLLVTGIIKQKDWMSLGFLPLDLLSNFGDLLSYLRLFALGIAGVEVAKAFNEMGMMILGSEPLAGITNAVGILGITKAVIIFVLLLAGSIFVIIFGHVLNIVLCLLSVLVHGVRLNALEFSMHMEQEWSGFQYEPFEKKISEEANSTA